MNERNESEMGGNGGGEMGGDEEGSVDVAGGKVFAELDGGEEMTLPEKWDDYDSC